MRPRALIAVTHLLGSGHLVRAMHLGRALVEGGFEVTLASGGTKLRAAPDARIAFVQLPPIKTEGTDFRTLLDEDGRPIDDVRRPLRKAMLAELAADIRPDVVVTEHFPFGRRQLADEFLGLIAAAKAANRESIALSSIRDVLVTPRADRIVEAERRIAEHFDAVLVHGDEAFLPLDASWPVSSELAKVLCYTGYLTAPEEDVPVVDHGEVIVSGGGSAASLPLFELAIAAAASRGDRRWRILAGQGIAAAEFARLQGLAPDHVVVERARPDFPALLAGCALSISQAGYNTVLDLVRAGRPAIVVPFDAGAETEQAVRAAAMERAGLARCLRLSGEEPLTPEVLGAAVDEQLRMGSVTSATIDRNGMGKVAGIVMRLLADQRRKTA
ncbi:glycosyltransferase [Bosea caraganae]|uniref:Glycosyltransferase n=1 Tax=Bosea caraganae TaxID=2763117 RepID=A0A370L2Z6_9HYPH|nr:glycosyltransferase [Bosea caraganae]RDJ20908.1 glycosyltransferase [Bosea caraganae]RDJ22559.1 glycosyltransferase [Bosea caraganae]